MGFESGALKNPNLDNPRNPGKVPGIHAPPGPDEPIVISKDLKSGWLPTKPAPWICFVGVKIKITMGFTSIWGISQKTDVLGTKQISSANLRPKKHLDLLADM